MFNGKLLFSVFNTALKSYSSKIVSVGNSINLPNISNPSLISCYSTSSDVVTYEDIKQIKRDDNVTLIDVREPLELIETGTIPGSINIPLGEIEAAFTQTPNELFLKKYGRPKPNSKDPIIFSCKSGKRSAIAQNIVQNIGYSNVRNYLGGWTDWETKQK
ncbi:rhodanese domain-containing protein CG4456-like isoform X2 [Aethina tumida]|uniref:rhodanese domain-containing protein CG4456-like isoform X2 n=1 Tax=Aethina tumida TaxID=116153 RepID=UPI002148B2EE|nr:rhodanese domain-containing protein CG4456-like isoform X2 [Aethina tumida]